MDLGNIVNVTISRQSTALSRQGFGTMLIVQEHTNFAERIRYYTSGADMVTDGFLVTDAAYLAAQIAFSQSPKPANVAIGRMAALETPNEYLAAIEAENPDWYGIIETLRTQSVVEEAAAWAEANERLFITASDDSDILNDAVDTDIATVLNGLSYSRSAVIYSGEAATKYPDAAAMAIMLASTPGSTTMKFKTLVGITADVLTATQVIAVTNEKANYHSEVAGVSMLAEGTVASGEFIDVIRDLDWYKAQISENIFYKMATLPKIPLTDGGIAAIEAEIRKVNADAVEKGVLTNDPAPTVTVPLAKDISAADRAARTLTGVTFTGQLAGAVHSTTIHGEIVA